MYLLFFAVATVLLGWILRSSTIQPIGWVAFSMFLLAKIPYYATTVKSPIETLLAVVGAIGSGYVALKIYDNHQVMTNLSGVFSCSGVIFIAANTQPLKQQLITATTKQFQLVVELLGYKTSIIQGPNDMASQLLLHSTGLSVYITMGCTGIGAISILAGLLAVAPSRNGKLSVLASICLVYILNIARGAFVTLAYTQQIFTHAPYLQKIVQYPQYESYFIAHTLISQLLSVAVLAAIYFWLSTKIPLLRQARDTIFNAFYNTSTDSTPFS